MVFCDQISSVTKSFARNQKSTNATWLWSKSNVLLPFLPKLLSLVKEKLKASQLVLALTPHEICLKKSFFNVVNPQKRQTKNVDCSNQPEHLAAETASTPARHRGSEIRRISAKQLMTQPTLGSLRSWRHFCCFLFNVFLI